ncbi:MAG: hypothetical protein ABI338_04030 [Gemmatimonadaceae bacterium]
MPRRLILATAAVPMLFLAACGGNDRPESSARSSVPGKAFGDSMVIRTTDGTMNLGLARDTVFMGLTDSVLTAARTDMARDTEETSSAIGRTIEKLVKKSVGNALQMKLRYPLADIDTVRYRDAAIEFKYRNKRRMSFENVSQSGHKALDSFDPGEAQRFVDFVNAAIHKERGGTQ